MTTRRLAVAAVAALAAGAACIVLGSAVLAEPGRLASARTALAAPRPVPADPGEGGFVSGILGTGGDRSALAAASSALRAQSLAAVVGAEKQLAQLASSGPGDRRSWAASFVAELELEQAQLGGQGAKQHAQAAVAALQAAVAADPANEDAKRNLELLLSQQDKHGSRSSQQSRRSSRQRAKARAGYTAPGWGW